MAAIVQKKILDGLEAPLPSLTRRGVEFPALAGKAVAVIGMRRAGKTSFLHQQRADLIAAGRAPERLVYFNFEDERLAGLEVGDLGLIPETQELRTQAAANLLGVWRRHATGRQAIPPKAVQSQPPPQLAAQGKRIPLPGRRSAATSCRSAVSAKAG